MDRQTSGQRPPKRARSAIACHRCKQRKQRCDNGFPSCTNCIATNHSCSYDTNVYPEHYVRTLESRVANLEAQLALDPAPYDIGSEDAVVDGGEEQSGPRQTVADRRDPHGIGTLTVTERLELETGFVPLSPDSYLGTSSGFPLAKVVQSACNASFLRGVHSGATYVGIAARPDGRADDATSSGADVEPHREAAKASMPSRTWGERLVQAYLTKVHPKHPFLSPRRIHQLNERRRTLRPCSESAVGQALEERLDYFILHMVYAIGARYLQLVGDYGHCSPEAHYAAAVEDFDAVFDVKTIENIEGMLLLAIYQLRSPSEPGIWSVIGVIMRHCLACGLHRKSNLPTLVDQRRKRVFWTAYMLERLIARTLGRPYCVTDREIDVDLPAAVDEDIEDEEEMARAVEEASHNPHRVTSMSPAIHIFRLQQLESKIHHTIYRVDRPTSGIDPQKITRLRSALEDWKSRIPSCVPGSDDENAPNPYIMTSYHVLQYHKAMLLLLLPLLPSLGPTHPDFGLCVDTAGQICQAYKRLHDDQQYLSYSMVALHTNFVAGLTMVYCFLVDKAIFDFKLSSDIRACSTVLYVIAERWSAARKVRNAFERLVRVAVEGGRESRQSAKATQSQMAPQGQNQNLADLSTQRISVAADTLGAAAPETLLPESSDVWNFLESVLDEDESNWRWTQDGLYNALGYFPEYGWTF